MLAAAGGAAARPRQGARIIALALAACGSDPVDPCPTGSCDLPGSTVIKWRFNEYAQWGFTQDTCLDLGIASVRVDVINVADPSLFDVADKPCGEFQATFVGLAEGMYDVSVTPLDQFGNPMVRASGTGTVTAAASGMPTEAVVNVPYTAWTNTYTGTFLFRLQWAGAMTCELAAPPVMTQTLTLLVDNAPVTMRTDTGQKLDGTDPRPCRSGEFAQFVELVPFGPATFVVVGKDATGAVRFERRYDTFVGAGKNNPTITVDVPPPPPPM